jgi:magnesium-transporting ATPase (P-type)
LIIICLSSNISKDFTGLSPDQVTAARAEFGVNSLTRRKRRGFWKSFFHNFNDPMIKVLLVALGVQIVMLFVNAFDGALETAGIAVAILIAVIVSTLSEMGSENAFEKLSNIAANIECRVRRGGKTIQIPVTDIVVGDIVLLGAGDKIPADGIIVNGSVEVDQSLLNGESKEAKKLTPQGVIARSEATRQSKMDFLSPLLLFSGTVVTNGEALMRVTAVGDKTEYGKIASELQDLQR